MFEEEFGRRVRSYMSFALEQATGMLPESDYEGRKFVAQRLMDCARTGKTTLEELCSTADLAAVELVSARKLRPNRARKPASAANPKRRANQV